MQKNANSYITSHNMINRIYDMVYFFGILRDSKNEMVVKRFFKDSLHKIDYVESLAKYFEKKLQQNYQSVELRYNLMDLINDLNYLKQHLS